MSDRRDEILDAAREIVRAEGIGALSLRGVARSLGVRAPSLYWHFDSKSALLVELQIQSLRAAAVSMSSHAQAWDSAQTSDKRRALARILGFVDGVVGMPIDHRDVLSLSGGSRQWLSDEGIADVGPHLAELLSAPRTALLQASAMGALHEGDAAARTIRLWLVVHGALAVAKFHRALPDLPAPAAEVLPATRDLLLGWGASRRVLDAIQPPPPAR